MTRGTSLVSFWQIPISPPKETVNLHYYIWVSSNILIPRPQCNMFLYECSFYIFPGWNSDLHVDFIAVHRNRKFSCLGWAHVHKDTEEVSYEFLHHASRSCRYTHTSLIFIRQFKENTLNRSLRTCIFLLYYFQISPETKAHTLSTLSLFPSLRALKSPVELTLQTYLFYISSACVDYWHWANSIRDSQVVWYLLGKIKTLWINGNQHKQRYTCTIQFK